VQGGAEGIEYARVERVSSEGSIHSPSDRTHFEQRTHWEGEKGLKIPAIFELCIKDICYTRLIQNTKGNEKKKIVATSARSIES